MALSSMNGPRKGSRYHRLDDIPKDSFTPRTYQIELLDVALKRNTILCLGSVESKVFLALMIAKQLSSVTRFPVEHGGKRTFYITDTTDEMNAIVTTLPHHTDLSIGKISPENLNESESSHDGGADFSESSDLNAANIWQNVFEANSIIVVPGSLFLTALHKNYVNLQHVNLLIFDDCHKCVSIDDHPYVNIVSKVADMGKDEKQPHIVGVTASIAGTECSRPESLQHTISSMEKAMMAHAETSMLILSERFGCRPKEFVIECQEILDNPPELTDELEDILLYSLEFFEDCRISKDADVDYRDPTEIPIKVLAECHNILQVLGSWCTSSIAEYFVMQIDKIIKYEKNDIHKKFLRCVCTTLRGLTKYFEKNFKPDYDIEEFLLYTTSKVRELAKILRNYKPEVDFMIINNDNPFDNDEDFSDMSEDNDEDEDSLMSGSDGEEEDDQKGKFSTSKPVHIAVKRTADGGHERIMTFSEEEEKNLCGVIFVKNHFIAFGLNKVIEEICSWDENLCFVKSSHIMGHGLRGSSNKQKSNKSYKRQEETLRKFRMQERNLIIATKELEEGIDIPKCNLVVCFDPPKDYRSYTLSKGRARARDASYYILLDEETHLSFSSNLNEFKGIEQVLLGQNRNQDSPQSEDEENFCVDEEDIKRILPPYSSGCAHVDINGAISLINKYCAKLPSDAFTHLTPQCRVEKIHGNQPNFRAYLRLPINSPVKEELQGPEMLSRKLAERAVALHMCEILHKKGELDENLVPVGKEMFLYEEEEEWADEEDQAGQARPGTTKRKQYYIKKVADALIQSQPKPGQPCYLHFFSLRLTGRITDEQNTRGRVIYAPEDTSQTLGVLMSKQIPPMPCFPIYTRSGEVTASVDLLDNGLILNDQEIDRLLKFHQFVFSGVLHLIKDPMEFSPCHADIGCIIVPLDGTNNLQIDWVFVDKVISFSGTSKRTAFGKQSKKEHFEFHTDDFKDAVVMPSYRNIDQPQHFYVAEIRQDLNPLSPFPSPELYKTFQDYYTTKYGLIITNTEQPLLDVDHTSARLNLLTPRYMNQKGVALPTSSAETKRARRENLQQKQILVPELCDVHVFPASLWRKTVCLPAILYRINCLLLSEELRCKISKETGIGIEELPEGFRFPKLDFGFETSPEKLKEAESSSSEEKSVDSSVEKTNDMSSLNGSVNGNDREIADSVHLVSKVKNIETNNESESPSQQCMSQKSGIQNIENKRFENDVTDINPYDGRSEKVFQSHKENIKDTEISTATENLKCENGLYLESELFLTQKDENNTDMTVSERVIPPCSDSEQPLLSLNESPTTRQQKASSTSTTPLQSASEDIHPHLNSSTPPSTKEEPVAQIMPPLLQSHSMRSSITVNTVDATVDSHIINSSSPTCSITKSAVTKESTEDNQNIPMQSSVDRSNMKNCLLQEDPHGAIDNIGNDQVLCFMPSISPHLNSSDSESVLTYPPSSSSMLQSLSSSSAPVPSLARSTTPGAADVNSLLKAGHSTTTISPVPVHNAPSLLQTSADSSNSSSSSSTAAENDISGFCQLHYREELELQTIHPKEVGAPQQNGNVTLTNNINVCAHQGCEHENEIRHPSALNQTSHPPPGIQKGSSQTICDKSCGSLNSKSRETHNPTDVPFSSKDFSSCFGNNQKASDKSDCLNHENHTDAKVCLSKNNGQSGKNKIIVNGVCPTHSESTFRVEEDYEILSSSAPKIMTSMSDSSPQNSFEPAIIINTLSAELNSELQIDLIESGLHTSPTFQSNESMWNERNKERSNEWQQSKQHVTGGWDKDGKSPTLGNIDTNLQFKDSDIIKFSFSNTAPNQEKKDVIINTWKSKEKETKISEAEACHPVPFQSSKITSKASEKENVPASADSTCSAKTTAASSFPISVWKSERPVVNALWKDQAHGKDGNTPVASSCAMGLDEDRDLSTFLGPSPCLILQALTMSNANDFFSLERLETIGDSFLKYAITVYLYCSYPGIHEGKLSYLRSKQVSNYNLYRLGRRKNIAEYMVSTKFEPYENWLPPGFVINNERRRGPVPKVVIVSSNTKASNAPRNFFVEEAGDSAKQDEAVQFNKELEWIQQTQEADQKDDLEDPDRAAVPYSLQCQHGLPDKSIADCMEALIGCYLTTCGRKAALMFMSWLGLKVLPKKLSQDARKGNHQVLANSKSVCQQISEQEFDELQCPPSPMFFRTPENEAQLNHLLEGFDSLEEKICYKFRDRSYLLQAFTHASYHYNTITDCYQRVEFLGDAILDYVITRHLYEDSQKYSPGILTDLRSALVNNNIFAALAVKWGFHCYFKAISPSLFAVIDRFVTKQKEKNCDEIDFDEEYQELSLEDGDTEEGNEEEDNEEEVEMEIPKALGDIFESVAGAIYLDSGMSLDTVWRVYYRMMKPYIDKYLKSIPKSLVRELLEREPETAKFERPERTINGKVRVTVNVVGKGVFSGVGRNYRIAKSAAAKKALRALRSLNQNGPV